jgi:hypothetical protein
MTANEFKESLRGLVGTSISNDEMIGMTTEFFSNEEYPGLTISALRGDKASMQKIVTLSNQKGFQKFGNTERERMLSGGNFLIAIFWSNKLKASS